jgi:deoxyadenosine/deoxycytidine kinase
MLSKHYKWIPHFEDVDHNPYLMDFYEGYAPLELQPQIFFLNSRLKQLVEIQKGTRDSDTRTALFMKMLTFLRRTCMRWA